MELVFEECQVRGCNGMALPVPIALTYDEAELLVNLCRRHEIDLFGGSAYGREERREAANEVDS